MSNGKLSRWLIRIFLWPTHLVNALPSYGILLKSRDYVLGLRNIGNDRNIKTFHILIVFKKKNRGTIHGSYKDLMLFP